MIMNGQLPASSPNTPGNKRDSFCKTLLLLRPTFAFPDRPYIYGTQPTTGLANTMCFLKCTLTYNVVGFNFVQIISLIFTFLNNFWCTFSIAMEKDTAQITSELSQTSLLRAMHIGAHKTLPCSWTSGILQSDSKVLQWKNSVGWRDALREPESFTGASHFQLSFSSPTQLHQKFKNTSMCSESRCCPALLMLADIVDGISLPSWWNCPNLSAWHLHCQMLLTKKDFIISGLFWN